MQIFFTSDNHFYHSNIIRYCKRPFLKEGDLDSKGNWVSSYIARERTEEMNLIMIRNWNERVKSGDLVFHLGDFCFKHAPSESPEAPKDAFDIIRPQLNGDIVFISGNHDSRNGVKSIIESLVIHYGGKRIFLTHDPKYAKEDFALNFCGHVHDKWKFQKLGKKSIICNLSVDMWDYRPVDYNQIFGAVSAWLKSGKKDE
jgi:calcineurin-like phosphoesterase family protein